MRPGAKAEWELYDLNTDRTEQHNLASAHPERVATMKAAYADWAKRCMVEPFPGQKKQQN